MTPFIAFGVVLVAAALALIVPPLLSKRQASRTARSGVNVAVYRDQARELDADLENGLLAPDQHEKARRELEARLLEDVVRAESATPSSRPAVKTAIALGTLLPVGALALYLVVGTPAALDPKTLQASSHQVDKQQLAEMVEKLAQKLKEDPENGVGWAMLARSYRYFGRYDEAAKAYANAVPRLEPNASLLADYADTLGSAQGKLEGEPSMLIAQALKIDPKNLKALALAGTAAFDRKDFAGAVRYWEQMVPLVPAGSEDAKSIEANIEEARGLGGIAGAKKASASAPAQTPALAQARVTGVVQLAPELAKKVSPTDTVLIYARAAEGSRVPLAILRRQARELPISFSLDDSMAMAPGMTLSKYDKVVIAARVAKTAGATAQPGDLEGTTPPVANTANNVALTINSEIR